MGLSWKNLGLGLIGFIIAPTIYFGVFFGKPGIFSANISHIPIINRFIPTPTLTLTPTPIPTITPIPTSTPTSTPTSIPSPIPSPTLLPVSGKQLDDWFSEYSNHYSIDPQKLWKIAVCESGLRTDAENGIYGGLYQFSPNAWKTTRITMNLDPDIRLRFNAEESIRTAAFKMSVSGYVAWPVCGLK
jgi:hypothetical protein